MYVSNTTDKLQGVLCFKDKTFALDTIPSVLTVTCPVHGQYVIYYNERLIGATYPTYYDRYAHNELCEVEVYGSSYYTHFCSTIIVIIIIIKMKLFNFFCKMIPQSILRFD